MCHDFILMLMITLKPPFTAIWPHKVGDACLRVAGTDAATFLQAQLTCDALNMPLHTTTLGAWCNAQGRVRAVLRITRFDNHFDCVLPASLLEHTQKTLSRYVMRSQVTITAVSCDGPSLAPAAFIAAGIPEITPDTAEQFVPQMLNLDQLGGVSFTKGCYPGQEIVARLHFKGGLKRRLAVFKVADAKPNVNDGVFSGSDLVGQVLDVADGVLSAVVQLTHVHETLTLADGAPLLPH